MAQHRISPTTCSHRRKSYCHTSRHSVIHTLALTRLRLARIIGRDCPRPLSSRSQHNTRRPPFMKMFVLIKDGHRVFHSIPLHWAFGSCCGKQLVDRFLLLQHTRFGSARGDGDTAATCVNGNTDEAGKVTGTRATHRSVHMPTAIAEDCPTCNIFSSSAQEIASQHTRMSSSSSSFQFKLHHP